MKFPTFIKNSTEERRERQQKLIKCNRQLLLTDNICRFQPQKQKNFINTQTTLIKDILNTSKLNETPSTDLYQFKSNKHNESVLNSTTTGRYAKSTQCKRLQRNRLHVTQKPATYALRSEMSIVNMQCSTPITPAFMISNGRRVNTDDDDSDEENCEPHKQQTPKTPLNRYEKNPQLSSAKNTPTTTTSAANRFSFSKLTKFASRSALKVINRKSIGSAGNSDSSSADSSSTSMITDEVEEVEEVIRVQETPKYNHNIYTSLEQQKQMEEKINRCMGKPGMVSRTSRAGQPSMGVTSCILKKLKKQTGNQYGMTTGLCSLPNSYLVGVPIVFNSENLVEKSTYDRLNREQVPFLGEERIVKKMVKPIVKSLSSISSVVSESPKLSTYKSTITQMSSPANPVNSCRISVFSSSKLNSNRLEQQLHYESFSEAIF